MKEVCAKHGQPIRLGMRGEHMARCITFDIGAWQATYGEGTVQLLAQRCGDERPYPCALTVAAGKACWAVRDVDVAMPGNGKAELQYRVGDAVVKAERYTTLVLESMGEAGPVPPEPEKSWVETVLQAASDAAESAKEAKAAARQTVVIGENGNWVIGGEDTGFSATGPQGQQGDSGLPATVSPAGASHALRLQNNTDYCFSDPVNSLTVTGFEAGIDGRSEAWSIHFVAGGSITVALPDTVVWNYGATPVFTPGSEYWLLFTPMLNGKVLGVWNEVEA